MKKIYFMLFLLAGLAACQSTSEPESGTDMQVPDELPESFAEFYERFLTDSLYQMEHILFPLQGLPDKADSTTIAGTDFRWQLEDWKLHRPIPANSDFAVSFRPLSETIIQENIRHESGVYAMERRYAEFDDGWYLIYYAGLNSVE
jgi:hypothetical protein